MLSQGQELAALDFADIIGGPLIAVINAQAKAANVTANFIDQVAFVPATGGGTGSQPQTRQLQTVVFNYGQVMGALGGGTGAGGNSALQDLSQVSVPLLTLIPIPYIRVDSMTISLNVQLNNSTTTTLSNNFTFNNTTTGSESAGFIWSESTSFTASVTDQNTYQNSQIVDDTYSLQVTVNAVQDQMPGGMQQVLGIFANLIQQQAALIQSIMTTAIQAQQQNIQKQLGTGGGGTGGGGGG